MSDLMNMLDRLFEADTQAQARRAARERLANLIDAARPRCGRCDLWMKSRHCPREVNVNGMNYGPSFSDLPCEKFVGSRGFQADVAALNAVLTAAAAKEGGHEVK